MAEEQRYLVHEATLIRRAQGGSMWSLRFRPFGGDLGATTSGADEIVVLVSPDKVDDMLFAVPYTLAEIDALREGEGEGAAR